MRGRGSWAWERVWMARVSVERMGVEERRGEFGVVLSVARVRGGVGRVG